MTMHSAQLVHGTHGLEDRTARRQRWLIRVVAAIASARSAIQAELRARRAAAELASLDDYMLRDIGLHRSEIQSVVRGRLPDKSRAPRPVAAPSSSSRQPVLR